ncbi:conserved membrane hypothetical protein [Hyella patelloides LEGE 07179]|uniref:DUF6798 domain-containing protein n=2 Tax=Hyella TaxID=945733 RepID=A0A563VRB9_9CYAN|nr:conserved membrane hypothetical protein [Hyella patelloides LEGE 07179]
MRLQKSSLFKLKFINIYNFCKMKMIAIFSNKKLLLLRFLLFATVFSLAYTQEPIYNSPENADGNQNTKFLYGLAQAGLGFLNQDWTANTIDPLPPFTFLVKFTYKYIHHEYAFYLYYGLIMGLYVTSLFGIVNYVYRLEDSLTKILLYLAFFLSIHTVNLEFGTFDTAWHLHSGVAQQYILGAVLQPCTFGVFILLSIWLALYKRYYWAVLASAFAATFHPAYIFSVAVFTLSYVLFVFPKDSQKAIAIGFLSLLLVLPIFSYMYFTFPATTPAIKKQAIDIIVNFRISHHSIPEVWLATGISHLQSLVTIAGLYLIRNTSLFRILLIPFITAFYLTILQVILDNDFIGFIAPWRLSVFLVPISTALIIAAFVSFITKLVGKQSTINHVLVGISLVIISALTVQGFDKQIALFQYRGESTPMLNFVKTNKQAEYTYLIPPNSQQLQKFRLYTGVPIFVNKKSHPYKDTEVIEWHNRVIRSNQVYEPKRNRCQLLQQLDTDYELTHVVAEIENQFSCSFLTTLYRDRKYVIYTIQ